MTDHDLPAFLDLFRTVTTVFNIRQDIDVLGPVYFKALRRFPLRLVAEAADRCTTALKRFPKPAEWADLVSRPTAPGVPALTVLEAADYREAETCGFEQPPCRCRLCQQAGVADKPLRYVPDFEEPQARLDDRVVTRGHWAHGHELARWYAAKAAFWATARRRGYGATVLQPIAAPAASRRATEALVAVGNPTREPGEDDA